MTCRVEEPNFFILNRLPLWARGLAGNVDVSEQGLQLRARPSFTLAREAALRQINIRDLAAGECDQVYLLDGATGALWSYDFNQDRLEQIDCLAKLFAGPAEAVSISAAPGTVYVAGTQAGARIFALATVNWQARWAITEHKDGAGWTLPLPPPFAPVDLATGHDGSLYALDRNNRAVLKFDVTGRLEAFGQPLPNTTLAALAAGPEQTLYVLDDIERKVFKLRETPGADGKKTFGIEKRPLSASDAFADFDRLIAEGTLPVEFTPRGLGADAQGHFYVGDFRGRQEGEEDDRFIRRFDAAGNYIGKVAGYRGAVEALAVDRKGRIFLSGQTASAQSKLFVLAPEPSFADEGETTLVKGSYFSRAFDSTALGTVWHKLMLDAEWPENTQVRVSHLSADANEVDNLLDKVAAGATPQERLDQLAWSFPPLVNPRDALLIKATGQFLWLRIDLFGNARRSPQVRSARVEFPRRSYLRYLPAVYQQDERSRDFLERFLSVFETFFAGTEEQIMHAVRYFDADAAVVQGEFLRWLSSWFAIAMDNEWDDAKLRALLKRAPELYKQRGTRAGLAALIELFTGDQPLIVEHFQTKACSSAGLSGSLAVAPKRCNAQVFGGSERFPEGLLRFERVYPAYIRQDESGVVTVELTALQELKNVVINEQVTGAQGLIRNGLRLDSQNLEFNYGSIKAGEKVKASYELIAGNSNGQISGTIETDARPAFASPPSPLIVRANFAELLRRLYGDDPYCFCVLLKPGQALTGSVRAAVRRLVESEKPAHTCAGVKALQPLIQLDWHTFLDINTRLSKPALRLDLAAIPQEAVLTDNEAGQLESHARLGIDTTLS